MQLNKNAINLIFKSGNKILTYKKEVYILDKILTDIIDIFNLKEAKLVRLSGLTLRERKMFYDITPQLLIRIINKLKKENVIHFSKIVYCPHCKEVFYLIEDVNGEKVCDTCGRKFNVSKLNTLNEYEVEGIVDVLMDNAGNLQQKNLKKS
jgi:hypothetical protein